MRNKEVYHSSAVEYNSVMAEAAEQLVESLEDPTVRKWCRSIANQHRYHASRHESSLAKLRGPKKKHKTKKHKPEQPSIAEEQAEYAKRIEEDNA